MNSLQEMHDNERGPVEFPMKFWVKSNDWWNGFGRVAKRLDNPIILDNIGVMTVVIAYVFTVYAMLTVFNIQEKFKIVLYSDLFARVAIIFTGLYVLYHIWKRSVRQVFTTRHIAGFLIIFLIMPVFKSTFASYKQSIPFIHPFDWDSVLMRVDYVLHFNHHPWRLLEPLLSIPGFVRAIDILYMSWFYVLFLSCLWMAWTVRRHLRKCYLLSTIMIWIIGGSVMGCIFSSAGPCFYTKVTSDTDNPYAALLDRLSDISENRMKTGNRHLYSTFNQAGLWEGNTTGTWGPFGGISAMPSIHVGMATLFAFLAFQIRRWLGWVFIFYAILIFVGSIILGWHYAVDGYAGIILASIIWFSISRSTNPENDIMDRIIK